MARFLISLCMLAAVAACNSFQGVQVVVDEDAVSSAEFRLD